jgi:hypothetical protein
VVDGDASAVCTVAAAGAAHCPSVLTKSSALTGPIKLRFIFPVLGLAQLGVVKAGRENQPPSFWSSNIRAGFPQPAKPRAAHASAIVSWTRWRGKTNVLVIAYPLKRILRHDDGRPRDSVVQRITGVGHWLIVQWPSKPLTEPLGLMPSWPNVLAHLLANMLFPVPFPWLPTNERARPPPLRRRRHRTKVRCAGRSRDRQASAHRQSGSE